LKKDSSLFFSAIGLAVTVIVLAACGGSGLSSSDETTRIVLSGSIRNSENVVNQNNVEDWTKTITDYVTPSCEFSFDSTSADTDIDIVSDAENCTSPNKCIVCTVMAAYGCSISCDGTVPSNTATAADTFNVYATFTSLFQSDMTTAAGALRFDGTIDGWLEFNPRDVTNGVSFDIAGCDGDPDMTVLDNDPLLNGDANGINAETPIDWSRAFSINALDPSPDRGGFGDCMIVQTLGASIQLTGADIPGSTIDLSGGSIAVFSRICDDTADCPPGELDDTLEGANPLPEVDVLYGDDDDETRANIKFLGDLDFFTFSMLAGRSFTIDVKVYNDSTTDYSLTDSYLTLYDSEGTYITHNDDYQNLGSCIDYTNETEETQIYYPAVKAYGDYYIGTYAIQFLGGTTCAELHGL